ncbi:hypothetical protein DSECCO2_498350 [anaerobic digester metagenome]
MPTNIIIASMEKRLIPTPDRKSARITPMMLSGTVARIIRGCAKLSRIAARSIYVSSTASKKVLAISLMVSFNILAFCPQAIW